MDLDQAEEMRRFIVENGYTDILELGFFHGVSTSYTAAILDEMGGGHITAIDLASAHDHDPNVDDLLATLGLQDYATIYYEPRSYTWRLLQFLDAEPRPAFDLCYIDGAHNWDADGFSFFLVDKLLKPGGTLVFDDLDWSYDRSPALRETEHVRQMPEDYRTTPQVRKVYELLVKEHPNYGEFMVKDGWASAKKVAASGQAAGPVRKEFVYRGEKEVGLGAALLRLLRALVRRLRPATQA
jgi:predicted O-methyltransferase YrrM